MGGVSVAGLRPGFGRGGITHSLEVTERVEDDKGDGAAAIGFIERGGGGGREAIAGASVTGDGAIDGVELLDVELMVKGVYSWLVIRVWVAVCILFREHEMH